MSKNGCAEVESYTDVVRVALVLGTIAAQGLWSAVQFDAKFGLGRSSCRDVYRITLPYLVLSLLPFTTSLFVFAYLCAGARFTS